MKQIALKNLHILSFARSSLYFILIANRPVTCDGATPLLTESNKPDLCFVLKFWGTDAQSTIVKLNKSVPYGSNSVSGKSTKV
jgi:hypothetical protein